MTKKAIIIEDQSLQDFLSEELDSIYYPGYSEEVKSSDPEKFNWELAEFKSQFPSRN